MRGKEKMNTFEILLEQMGLFVICWFLQNVL